MCEYERGSIFVNMCVCFPCVLNTNVAKRFAVERTKTQN